MSFAMKRKEKGKEKGIKEAIKEEKRLEYFSKECKLSENEGKIIMDLSEKLNLEPQRIIETIWFHARNGRLNEDMIRRYELAINETKKAIEENEIKYLEMKNKKAGGILSGFNPFSEEKILEATIKHDKSRVEKYEKIKEILKIAIKHPALVEKIYRNTNYRPFTETAL